MEHWINCFEDHSQEDLDKIKENVVWQNAWMGMLEGNLALSATAVFQGSTKWASHLETWGWAERGAVEKLVCFGLSEPEFISFDGRIWMLLKGQANEHDQALISL